MKNNSKLNKIPLSEILKLIDKMDEFERTNEPESPEYNEYIEKFEPFKKHIMQSYAEYVLDCASEKSSNLSENEIKFVLDFFIIIEEYEKCQILSNILNENSVKNINTATN